MLNLEPFTHVVTPLAWPDFRGRILAFYKPPLRSRSTFLSVRRSLDLFEGLGGIQSTLDLNTQRIGQFVRSREGRENPNTTRTHLRKLSSICTVAEAEGWLAVNPFRVRRSWVRGLPPRIPRIPTRAETRRILDLAKLEASTEPPGKRWRARRLYAVAATAIFTGMRKTEILTLRVDDVHLADRIIELSERLDRRYKCETAAGLVPIAEPLAPILEGWIAQVAESDFLFPGATGAGPWLGGPPGYRPDNQIQKLGERAGIRKITFSSFRHGFATHSEHFGLTELQVARILRHTTTGTQRFYRHAEAENLRAMVGNILF